MWMWTSLGTITLPGTRGEQEEPAALSGHALLCPLGISAQSLPGPLLAWQEGRTWRSQPAWKSLCCGHTPAECRLCLICPRAGWPSREGVADSILLSKGVPRHLMDAGAPGAGQTSRTHVVHRGKLWPWGDTQQAQCPPTRRLLTQGRPSPLNPPEAM